MNELKQKLFSEKQILLGRRASSVWDDNDIRVYWEGLLFVDGTASGEESIKLFINELKKVGITKACHILKGVFFIIVENKSDDDLYIFVDNAGLYQAFYTNNNISNSFLELIKHEKCKVTDLDPEAVYEFLYFGYFFLDRTFFRFVKKIPGDKVFHYTCKDGKRHVLDKNISYFNVASINELKSFDEIFEKLAISLSNRNVSIDLTGGVDSRLIAAVLGYYGMKFETASSGGTADYEDVAIARDVANALGHPYYSTVHSISSLEEDLTDLFFSTDGLYDMLYYHRLLQFAKSRVSRGMDTMISGVGGELFKDYWWLQDFPFYNKHSPNIERLVDIRIMTFKPIQDVLTKNYSEIGRSLRSKIIQELSRYSLETNTKTYDNIFFNFMMKNVGGRGLTNNSFFIQTYAAYLDLDMIRIGFNLPRRLRFFNMFHRKEITRINPLIARIPTSEGGITVSIEAVNVIGDLPKYLNDRLKRLYLKLKKQNKSFTTRENPNSRCQVKNMKVMKHSIEILKDNGFLNDEVEMDQIDDKRLGMYLSLAMLIKYMNDGGCHSWS